MKKITFSIPEELDERFRKHIASEYMGIKGALSIVGTKAIKQYLKDIE